MLYYQSLPVHSNNKIMLLQDVDIGLERTKMDIEARSQSKKDQMSGKVSFQNNIFDHSSNKCHIHLLSFGESHLPVKFLFIGLYVRNIQRYHFQEAWCRSSEGLHHYLSLEYMNCSSTFFTHLPWGRAWHRQLGEEYFLQLSCPVLSLLQLSWGCCYVELIVFWLAAVQA